MWLEFILFKTAGLTVFLPVLCSSVALKANVTAQGGRGLPAVTGSMRSSCQTGPYTHTYVYPRVDWPDLSGHYPSALVWGETNHFWVKTQDCSRFFSTVTDETKNYWNNPASAASPAELAPGASCKQNHLRTGMSRSNPIQSERNWCAKTDEPPLGESSSPRRSHLRRQEEWLISYTAAVIATSTALKCQPSNVTFCRSIIFIHRAADFGGC